MPRLYGYSGRGFHNYDEGLGNHDGLEIGDPYVLDLANRYHSGSSIQECGATISRRKITMPKKKSIKESIPFSNITYDFTNINGEPYFEDRTLTYELEIIADDFKDLSHRKRVLKQLVMSAYRSPLYDPYEPNYHFVATYEDMSFDDDESLLKTTATVIFSAYPYMISDYESQYTFDVDSNKKYIDVPNGFDDPYTDEAMHGTIATVTTDVPITISHDGRTIVIDCTPESRSSHKVYLKKGENRFVINSNAGPGKVYFNFFEEVM